MQDWQNGLWLKFPLAACRNCRVYQDRMIWSESHFIWRASTLHEVLRSNIFQFSPKSTCGKMARSRRTLNEWSTPLENLSAPRETGEGGRRDDEFAECSLFCLHYKSQRIVRGWFPSPRRVGKSVDFLLRKRSDSTKKNVSTLTRPRAWKRLVEIHQVQ